MEAILWKLCTDATWRDIPEEFCPWKTAYNRLMCAEKTGGFNLVNYRHSSGVYHEQETEDLHRRI